MTMEAFLDRLMIAESGGRVTAKNPRSTALGPFQFIEGTFLAVARRYFATEIQGMAPLEILALRTDMKFARRAAEAYTRENAAVLQSLDVAASYPNLRLAFLLGPAGAARVLKAPPDAPLAGLLGPAVLVANPFMATMTARGLAQRSAREVSLPVTSTDGVVVAPGTMLPRRALPPGIAVRCNLRLPSCKRWLALHSARKSAGAVAVTKVAVAGPVIAAGRGNPKLNSRPVGRVSPTMEAAARGIPLKQSALRAGKKGRSPKGKLTRNRS